MSSDGSLELIRTSYEQISGNITPSGSIDRDEIPAIGEKIYKEYTAYPILK